MDHHRVRQMSVVCNKVLGIELVIFTEPIYDIVKLWTNVRLIHIHFIFNPIILYKPTYINEICFEFKNYFKVLKCTAGNYNVFMESEIVTSHCKKKQNTKNWTVILQEDVLKKPFGQYNYLKIHYRNIIK